MLGLEFSEILTIAGAQIVIGGKNIEKVKQAAERLGGFAVEMDVTRKESVEQAVQETVAQYGRIDGLVNNASYSTPVEEGGDNFASFENYSEKAWEKSFAVDVKGTFLCSQAVGKLMVKQRGGTIVNVSSIYGKLAPDPRVYEDVVNSEGERFVKPASYGAAKSAIANLTRYLAVYWREQNIRVNSLTLGGVFDNQNESFVKAYASRTPLGRMAKKNEYNGALIFLMSDASSYMTGADLVMDGGLSAW